jgi:hypothetical protein
MLIRSHDKKMLVPINLGVPCIEKYDTGWHIYLNSGYLQDAWWDLGHYTSEAKAIKVLDMIQTAYESSLYSDHAYDNAAQVQRPYVFANNRVFQMPSDEEVEG